MRDINGNYIQVLDTYDENLDEPQEDSIGTCDLCGSDYYEGEEADWLDFQCCTDCAVD